MAAPVLGESECHNDCGEVRVKAYCLVKAPGDRAAERKGGHTRRGGRRRWRVGGVGLGTALEPGDSGEGGHTRRNPQSLPPAEAA